MKKTKAEKGAGGRKQIPAGVFKAHCLGVMDRVRERGEEYVITKHGKPVARLVPVPGAEPPASPFGWMHGSATINGDIVEPIDVPWEAVSDDE